MFADRLLAKITIGDGCWEWQGAKAAGGYGYIQRGVRGLGVARAHRAMFEFLIGPIPEGTELDHLCRNPGCVNPGHLEPVTHRENIRRGAGSALRTHCPQGHEFSAENTHYYKGARKCRACFRVHNLRKTARRRAKENPGGMVS